MIVEIVHYFLLVMTIAVVIRALLSWFPNVDPRNPLVEFLISITEPVLAPIRAIMPRMGMFDLTPMVAIIVLQVIDSIVVRQAG